MGNCCSTNTTNFDIGEEKIPSNMDHGSVFQVPTSTPLLENINFELTKENAEDDTSDSSSSIDDSEIERLIAEEDESDSN